MLYLQSEGGLRTQRGRRAGCEKRWRFYLCSRGVPEPGTRKVKGAKERRMLVSG